MFNQILFSPITKNSTCFAKLIREKYNSNTPKANVVATKQQRLWGIFVLLFGIDKNKLCNLKFVKYLDNVVEKIEFKNVGFTFIEYEKVNNNKLTKKERKILKNKPQKRKIISKDRIFNNLSFTIKPNSNVAFVGRSVSGKSTILNLMSKMYEVDSGKVLIDGVDIKKMEKSKMLGPSMNCLKIIPNLEVCFMLKNPKIK